MTLNYVAVDVEKSFAPGQAYVGLSRCRSPTSLQILGSRGVQGLRRACQVDGSVIKFYEQQGIEFPPKQQTLIRKFHHVPRNIVGEKDSVHPGAL